MKTKIFIACLISIFFQTAFAQVELARNVNPEQLNGCCHSTPKDYTRSGSITYFTAYSFGKGRELWKTDGTAAGTVLVKDIRPDCEDSDIEFLTDVNGILYFSANDGTSGKELWRSNGTASGTYPVLDIRTGSLGSTPMELINIGGTLYFAANNGTHGFELWRKTATGSPMRLTDLKTGTLHSFPCFLTDVGGVLHFTADGPSGFELYKWNGTSPVPIDIYPGTSSSFPTNLVNVNGTLFFSATKTGVGRDLFWYDGITVGNDNSIAPGAVSSMPQDLTNVNGTLFFTATTTANGRELYRRTSAGVITPFNIRANSASSDPTLLTAVGSTCYFSANDGVSGRELWKCGTSGSPSMVMDINTYGSSSPTDLVNVNGVLYFVADNSSSGDASSHVWRSSGTTTNRLKYISATGYCHETYKSPRPHDLTNINGMLYFSAEDRYTGNEPWKSNGTEAGTVLIKDIHICGANSNPRELTSIGGQLYFSATHPTVGREIWNTPNGSNYGYFQIAPLEAASFPYELTDAGSRLYFGATGPNGRELYKINPSTNQSALVSDIHPSGSSNPSELTYVKNGANDMLYFAATTSTSGTELYRVASSTSGAVMVSDLCTTGSSNPTSLCAAGTTLYFAAARNATEGTELFKVGPSGSPSFVRNIRSSGSSSPAEITDLNGTRIIFTADDGVSGRKLYRSDGTSSTTVQIPGAYSNPRSLIWGGRYSNSTFVNLVYFIANDGSGDKLFVTDGMTVTSLGASSPEQLVVDQYGQLYFTADDGVNGRQLWTSSGTVSGTRRVLKTSTEGYDNPKYITRVEDGIAFATSDSIFIFGSGCKEGFELLCGTEVRGNFADFGDHLYFPAYREDVGDELFRVSRTCYYVLYKTSEEEITSVSTEAVKMETLTLNAYPNPAREQLKVSITADEARKGALMVFDISGKQLENISLMLQQGSNEVAVKTESLPNGMYFIRYADEKVQKALQFVVQH